MYVIIAEATKMGLGAMADGYRPLRLAQEAALRVGLTSSPRARVPLAGGLRLNSSGR